jgi:hypothetical protein
MAGPEATAKRALYRLPREYPQTTIHSIMPHMACNMRPIVAWCSMQRCRGIQYLFSPSEAYITTRVCLLLYQQATTICHPTSPPSKSETSTFTTIINNPYTFAKFVDRIPSFKQNKPHLPLANMQYQYLLVAALASLASALPQQIVSGSEVTGTTCIDENLFVSPSSYISTT